MNWCVRVWFLHYYIIYFKYAYFKHFSVLTVEALGLLTQNMKKNCAQNELFEDWV